MTISRKQAILVATVAILSVQISGCQEQKAPVEKKIDQAKVCLFNSIQNADCKDGQLSMFAPPQWGNEQLPIYAAAQFCDFNYPIIQNNGGVLCVFTSQRLPIKSADGK